MNALKKPIIIVVDLDGTLIEGDTFWMSVALIARRRPWHWIAIVVWGLLFGRAYTKDKVARLVMPDVAHLPFRKLILDELRALKIGGTKLVLATGANHRIAIAVAAHLDLFDRVFASSRRVNLIGRAKADALVKAFGHGQFDYWGDSYQDIPVWECAATAVLVGGARNVLYALQKKKIVALTK